MEEDQEKQKIIDELYHEVWSLLDDISNLKTRLLEIGEKMKEVTSPKVFK